MAERLQAGELLQFPAVGDNCTQHATWAESGDPYPMRYTYVSCSVEGRAWLLLRLVHCCKRRMKGGAPLLQCASALLHSSKGQVFTSVQAHNHSPSAQPPLLLLLLLQGCEPNVIMLREHLPWSDERFRGYGFDRVRGTRRCRCLPATKARAQEGTGHPRNANP